MVVEELLRLSGSVHHLVINAGDVEHQPHHQTEACTQHSNMTQSQRGAETAAVCSGRGMGLLAVMRNRAKLEKGVSTHFSFIETDKCGSLYGS